MCRRKRLSTVWAIALLLAVASPVQAQQTEAELQRQIDSLAPLVEQAGIEAQAAQQALEAAARAEALAGGVADRTVDTLRIHGMRILVSPDDAPTARELFEEVWSETYRGTSSPWFSRRTFVYQIALRGSQEIQVGPDEQRQGVLISPWFSRDQTKKHIRSAIGQVLAQDLGGTALGDWSHGGNPFEGRDPAQLYRWMVATASVAVHSCLDGGVDACIASLSLGPQSRDPLHVWYTAEQLAAIDASRLDQPYRDLRACEAGMPTAGTPRTDTGDPDCESLRGHAIWSLAPIRFARETLVGQALERGGLGAWSRLVEDPSMSPEQALEYASGVDLEELVTEWRAWIVTNRPEVYAGLGGKSAFALLWVLVFAALATRSTRWRFA